MNDDAWQSVLAAALTVNAVLGLGYRVFRFTKGGPASDVVGQGILGVLLAATAIGAAVGAAWSRWVALVYGGLFGLAVMPIWVLAILIPLRPKAIDYTFTGIYWVNLFVIVTAAIAA